MLANQGNERASQEILVVKNLSANAGDVRDMGSIPGLGRSLGGRAWQPTPVWTEEPGHLQFMGSRRVGHDWKWLSTHTWIYKCECSVMSNSFVTPWTVTCQASLSMEFSRQEYWNGLPFPVPGVLPNSEIQPLSLASPALAFEFFTTLLPGKP